MGRPLAFGIILIFGALSPCVANEDQSTQLLRGSSIRIVPQDSSAVLPSTALPSTAGSGSGRPEASVERMDSLDMPLQKTSSETAPQRTASESLFSGMLPTVAGALAITLGLFCVWAAVMRRGGIKTGGRHLPKEAVEVIGHTAVGPKEKILVLRCGMQAIVVGVTPAGMQTLAQFDDPDEAGQFIASCRGMNATRNFQNAIREMEREPIAPGFVDNGSSQKRESSPSSSRLFLRA